MANATQADIDKDFLKACESGNLDEVLKILYYHDNGPTKLLEKDPDTLDHMHYFHAVCFHGHHEIVEQLFFFGVDVNLKSRHGTPLTVASQAGHLETVKLLVKHGAVIFDPDVPQSLTPVFQACKHGHHDVVEYLIAEKPTIISMLGHLLLVQACHDGYLDIVVFLVSKDIDVNDTSLCGSPNVGISFDSLVDSPLHAACSQNHIDVVEYLLQEGAEVTVHAVEHFFEVLGQAVARNFKQHRGRSKKKKDSRLEGDFRAANFYAVHESWFTCHSQQLVILDLSCNYLQKIPSEIMNLPSLKEIDLSGNVLLELPEVNDVVSSRLEDISASSNKLEHVPCSFFNIQGLRYLNLARNNIASLLTVQYDGYLDLEENSEEVLWQCSSLKSLNLAKNELTSIPVAIRAARSLEKLQISDNNLSSFPGGWKCPLRILSLAKNKLSDFQQSVFNTWVQTLEDLNLSSNELTMISWDICQLQSLQRLDMSNNKIESLPPKSYWTCTNLRRLNLAGNKLRGVRQSVETLGPRLNKRFSITRSPSADEHVFIEDEFAHEVFGGTLENLDVSNNDLHAIPSSLCQLTSLEELDLSGNRHLKTLPPELGNLTECYQLGLDGLNLSSIPKYARQGGHATSRDILTYLRAKQRNCIPYYRMKLMVIGLQGRGKTTLLAALRNKPLPPNISTVGIVVNEWTIPGSQSLRERVALLSKKEPTNPNITFSTWDLAGQQIYYSTHQCFLSSNTLYLAVWNTSHGEEGIEKLKPWLLNVQARAPGSHVIIIGTHADLLPEKGKTKRLQELCLKIMKRYSKKGYPAIKGNYVVSCTTGENIPVLRQAIYSAALELKEAESTGKGESLIGRQIPASYLKLQENVMKEAEARKKDNLPPILSEEQMLDLAKQDPNNDILERDELILAARFLHENGVILHYEDHTRGLDKLYFIEPGWLCKIMALLVTVKETNAFVKGGIIERSNVNLLLQNPRLPSKFMEQYIQLMERFEVALTLDEHRLLVPSMLPRDKPGLQLRDLRKTPSAENREESGVNPSEYLKRLYKMNYVPSGFWSRLIARLMIAIQRWGADEGIGDELICQEDGESVRSRNIRPVPHGYSMIYWREGMGVVYERGYLLVESFKDKERSEYTGTLEDIEGVMVTVWSAQKDFSVLGFVTDHVNSLISEWYPGLEECDKYGVPLVRHIIPCPTCAKLGSFTTKLSRSLSVENFQKPEVKSKEFLLTECAAAAVRHHEISCPYHEDEPVKLAALVPDLMLSDLPEEFLVDSKAFVFHPVDENRLGAGGAGEVFFGTYKKQKVAIKRFYSTKESWAEMDSGIGSDLGYSGNRGRSRHTDGGSIGGRRVFSSRMTTIEEELRRTKILSSFWELRQEVSVLGRLNHPCVVALIGVCLRPLCIVLELSPMGSLFSILEAEMKNQDEARFQEHSQASIDVKKTIFDRDLTYKIVYQVAHALSYLHSLGIIYRDLKSDNLLVWTLDKDATVHVKLSDYGISRFATPQGMLGEEGTPGFQAPEVRPGSSYNEKVDIFSFGMLIYEILSGLRPFHECRSSAQIKKALRRGDRPSLQRSCIDTQMPEMEALMEKCWQEGISRRPSADAILSRMEDPSFLCLNRVLPYADQQSWTSVTAFIPLSTDDQVLSNNGSSSKGSHSVLMWGGEHEERCYSVIDCQTGFYQVPESPCLGSRVACLAKVGERYWLGTEGSAIDVFGRAGPSGDLKVLWSIKMKAHVLGLEVEQYPNVSLDKSSAQHVRRVFASLDNGTVVAISRNDLRQSCSTSCGFQFRSDANEKLRQEATVFSVTTTVELDERNSPACCLLFVNLGKELWVGCGNKVAIVDVDTLEVIHKFKVYTLRQCNVRAMVTNGPSVFIINRQTAEVFQWQVATRQLLYKFSCIMDNLRDYVIAQKITLKEDTAKDDDVITGNDDDFPAPGTSDQKQVDVLEIPTEVESEPNSLQILPEVPRIPDSAGYSKQPSLKSSFKQRLLRNSSRKKPKVANEVAPESTSRSNSEKMRSRTHVMANAKKRITCALVVGGNLWLGRETGDIVVVDISCEEANPEYGKVLAVLSIGKEPGHIKQEVHGMKKVGRDRVVSCARLLRERGFNKTTQIKSKTIPSKQKSFVSSLSPFNTFVRTQPAKQVESQEPPREKFQVAIWERWNNGEFKQFYKYHEDLENAF